MRFRIQSLVLLSRLRIRHCIAMSCNRPAATAVVRPLAWEPPYAGGATLEKAKDKKKKKKISPPQKAGSFKGGDSLMGVWVCPSWHSVVSNTELIKLNKVSKREFSPEFFVSESSWHQQGYLWNSWAEHFISAFPWNVGFIPNPSLISQILPDCQVWWGRRKIWRPSHGVLFSHYPCCLKAFTASDFT